MKEKAKGWVMVELHDCEHLISLFARRELRPLDGSVVLALITEMDTHNCRIHVKPSVIAEKLNVKDHVIQNSFARLKKHHYLRTVEDPRTKQTFFLLNPWAFKAGKPGLVNYAQSLFMEA